VEDSVVDVPLAPGPDRWSVRALLVGFATSMLAVAIDAAAFAQAPLGAQPKAGEPQQAQLSYSPWTKLCVRGPRAQLACFTGKDAQVESGLQAVAAVLIERAGETRKLLRVILPLGMRLPPGTRVLIDQSEPRNAPYVICFSSGCVSDYEANDELIENMKGSEQLVVQAINGQGQAISLTLPLNDFGKAYDSPPSDPKGFEELRK
jgi:invasion protein IalB